MAVRRHRVPPGATVWRFGAIRWRSGAILPSALDPTPLDHGEPPASDRLYRQLTEGEIPGGALIEPLVLHQHADQRVGLRLDLHRDQRVDGRAIVERHADERRPLERPSPAADE